ncbi:MAG: hypothetical protein IKD66_00495 [Solobacterium sp.]|nr:hypothetical protein [Solobacterium sp.]
MQVQINEGAVLTIVLACIAAPGFWDLLKSLFDKLLGRKRVTLEEIDEKLDGQRKDIDRLKDRFTELEGAEAQEAAQGARRRILRFNDELLRNIDHSKEYFDDVLEDIKTYEDYCHTHPSFENGKTVMADKNIKRCYELCMEKQSFLK